MCEFLANKGITTSVHFKPLSEMTYWKKAVVGDLKNTNTVWKKLLSLPCYNSLTNDEVAYIINSVNEFYGA